jgi:hypothetical protein
MLKKAITIMTNAINAIPGYGYTVKVGSAYKFV